MTRIHLFWTRWRAVLLVFPGLFALTSIIFGWPVHYALSVKGLITDQITHEPIPDAIIECEWVKKSALGIIEAVSQGIETDYFVSNNRGEYKIPGKLSLHIFSWYANMNATLRHPLYETFKLMVVGNKEIKAYGCWQQKAKTGKFTCDIAVMKLEDKYRGRDLKEAADFAGTTIGAGLYAKQSKKVGILTDWNSVFAVWDEIAKKYVKSGISLEDTKKRIRTVMGSKDEN